MNVILQTRVLQLFKQFALTRIHPIIDLLLYIEYSFCMENEDNSDKLTQARSSRDKGSFLQSFYSRLCCCFPYAFQNGNAASSQKQKDYQAGNFETTQIRNSNKIASMMSEDSEVHRAETKVRKQLLLFRSVYEHANRLLQEYDEGLDKSTVKKWHSYSIYEYKQNQLLALGTTKGRVLCKISCVRVQASANAKKKTSKSRTSQRSQSFTSSSFDKYWNKRYLLFQKFDEGISLDDQSWYSVTPEAVAEHIAGKIRCQTVLDGFCGAGGDSIKLSNTCSRVIANDICLIKLKCLQTNAKVYSVENIEMLNQNFLDLEGIQPDVVYLAPPFGPEQNLVGNSTQPSDLDPSLDKIFAKAIQLSKNIVMLLPPNMNVRKLGQLIATQYINSKVPSSTCSIKIQKIFFMSQLKYIAIYIGSIIQNQINLNDELCFIYNYLKEGEQRVFTHKKVIRQLRQKYGMINLLNFVFDLDKVQVSGTLIQKLYSLIKQKELIEPNRLQKLIKQQILQYQRYNRKKIPLISEKEIVEEEKYTGEDLEKERTVSYYSGVSAANKTISYPQSKADFNEDKQLKIASITGNNYDSQSLPRANTIEFCPGDGSDSFSDNISRTSGMSQYQSYK